MDSAFVLYDSLKTNQEESKMTFKHLAQQLIILMTSLFATACFAFTNEVTLDFDDAHIKGKNVIFLKKALKDQYPNLNFKNQKLKQIVVLGKSKRGKGKIQMRVGNWTSNTEIIDGNTHDFNKRYNDSFNYISLDNNHEYSDGKWQLLTKGNLKIRKIILVMEDNRFSRRSWWKPMSDQVTDYEPRNEYRPYPYWENHMGRHHLYGYY